VTALEWMIAAFCTWQVVEIARHGEILTDWRAFAESCIGGWQGFLASLFLCPWCLSVWVGWAVVITMQLFAYFCPELLFLVYGLAVSRTANLLNDLMYHTTRTPKVNVPDDE